MRPAWSQDPRTTARLAWTAPGEDADAGLVSAYEIRLAPVPPGGDLEAWWNTADVQATPPVPQPAGTRQSWFTPGLNPDVPAYAAVRARDAAGQWSPLTAVAGRPRPGAVFAHAVSPTRTDPGPIVFVITGLGLETVTQVRFHTGGGVFPAASLDHDGARLRVVAVVTEAWTGPVEVELLAAAGEDRLRGWLEVVAPPEPEDTTPPSVVTDLVADVVDSFTVLLTWTAPGDSRGDEMVPVASYELRRLDASGSFTGGTPVPAPAPGAPGDPQTVTVGNLEPGSRVRFAVAARDTAGNLSAPSDPAGVSLPAPDLTAPEPVTGLAYTLDPAGGVELRWAAAEDASGITGYLVRSQAGPPEVFAWETATPVAATAPGVLRAQAGTVGAGTVSCFAVVARDGAGNLSDPGAPLVVDRRDEDGIAPGAPGDLEAGRFGPGRVQLRWRASGDDGDVGSVAGYGLVLIENPAPGSWWEGLPEHGIVLPPRPAGKRVFYNVGELEGGAVYGFALRAYDEAGNASPWSEVLLYVEGRTQAAAAPPAAPGGLAGEVQAGGVLLTWDPAPEANVAAYVIQRSEPDGQTFEIGSVPVAELTFLDPDPVPGACRYAVLSETGNGIRSALSLSVLVDVPGADAVTATATGRGWNLSAPAPLAREAPSLQIFDVRGRLLAEPRAVVDGGGWRADWDGADGNGRPVGPGVVFVRVRGCGILAVHKLLITR